MKTNLPCIAILALTLAAFAAPTATTKPDSPLDHLPAIEPLLRPYLPERNLSIYNPKAHDAKKDKRPAILCIHGGGWGSGEPKLWEPHCRYFANEGLVAISVQYRLMSEKISLFDCIADVKAAVRHVRKNAADIGIDPDKITVIGDSAGGHLVACTALIDGLEAPDQDLKISSRPNALVLIYPVLDLTSPDGWNLKKNSGKPGEAVLPRARELSPSDHVVQGAPPTLIFHGVKDTIVNVACSDRFVAAMKKAGNTCQYIRLEGKDHAFITRGWGDDATIVKSLGQVDDFLRTLAYLPK